MDAYIHFLEVQSSEGQVPPGHPTPNAPQCIRKGVEILNRPKMESPQRLDRMTHSAVRYSRGKQCIGAFQPVAGTSPPGGVHFDETLAAQPLLFDSCATAIGYIGCAAQSQ